MELLSFPTPLCVTSTMTAHVDVFPTRLPEIIPCLVYVEAGSIARLCSDEILEVGHTHKSSISQSIFWRTLLFNLFYFKSTSSKNERAFTILVMTPIGLCFVKLRVKLKGILNELHTLNNAAGLVNKL